MKKYIVMTILGLILLGMFFITGCFTNDEPNLPGGWTWKFRNRSSHTVKVSPNNQSWSEFTFNPGQDWDVRVNENGGTIKYYYIPDTVYRVTDPEENNWITFYDL